MSSNYPSSALRNGAGSDTRYSKEQLLNLYKAQRDSGALNKNVAEYFAADWNPRPDTSPVNGAWGRREDSKDNSSGPEVCWDHGGQMEPLGLVDMTDEEKEVGLPPLVFLRLPCFASVSFFPGGFLPQPMSPPWLRERVAKRCLAVYPLGQLPTQAASCERLQRNPWHRNRRTQIFHLLLAGPHEQLQLPIP